MRLVAAVLIVTSCSHPKGPAMPQSDCTRAIEGFASAEPARLHSLPTTCTLDDVKATLHATDATARGSLGTSSDWVNIYWFTSDKLKKIRAWVDQRGHVILLDAEYPPGSADDYIHALGEPDKKLDYPWNNVTVPAGEHVWLRSGATIVANAEYIKGVLRVGVFAPGISLEQYEKSVRYTEVEDTEQE
jgi:hypothetical protein